MLLVTSRSVMPTYCARVRSTLTSKLGLLFGLLDARIGEARNIPQAAQQVLRIARFAPDSDRGFGVDRRGRAKFRIWL